jgi:putative tryptophan/tyrosine transport system substrate-binding protein
MRKTFIYLTLSTLLYALSFVGAMLVALSFPAQAQQPGKVPLIGILFFGSQNQPHLKSFQQGLRDLGYVEGKNIAFEYRYAEGDVNRLPELAADLVRLKVDLIVTTSNEGGLAARQVTKSTPVVLTTADPVGAGLAASLAKPGGNVTGLSVVLADLSGKRLELLKETFPTIKRVGVLWSPMQPTAMSAITETQAAGEAAALQLTSLEVRTSEDIDTAVAQAAKTRPSALLVILDTLTTRHSKKIVDIAAKHRLPGMYPTRQFAEEGGLMAYGPSIGDLYRRAATYVDKILKGSKPADLPVEQPTRFEFAINLKTANQIGVTIPPEVLMRADKVIR